MTALSAPALPGTVVPAPRAAVPHVPAPRIPTPRTPVDRAPSAPAEGSGRHRAVAARVIGRRRTDVVTLAARAGSTVTLAAMLVLAAASAGLTDGVAPTGAAAEVASATLR